MHIIKNHTLSTDGVTTFTNELQSVHHEKTHPIPNIPPGYTIADALMYIFTGNIERVSQVFQEYADGSDEATQLFQAIQQGITKHAICLTCVKQALTGDETLHMHRSQ